MLHQKEKYNLDCQCSSGRIPDDEPVFLLRGSDPLAPILVRAWADLAFADKRIDALEYDSLLLHAVKMKTYRLES